MDYENKDKRMLRSIGICPNHAQFDFMRSRNRCKLDIEFENKVYAIYQYTAAVLFVREMFPNLKKDEIGVVAVSYTHLSL